MQAAAASKTSDSEDNMPAYYDQQATGLDTQYYSPTSTSNSSNSWIPGWAGEQVSAGASTAIKQIDGVRQLVTRWWKANGMDSLPIDGSADAEGAEGDTAARDQQQAGPVEGHQPCHKRTRSWNDAWAQLPQLRLKDMAQHLPALPALPFAGRRDDFALPVTNQQASNMLMMEQRRKELTEQDPAAHLHHWAMS